jgi:hypothetical protein
MIVDRGLLLAEAAGLQIPLDLAKRNEIRLVHFPHAM